MRPGWIVSAIGHAGAVMLTLVAWPAAHSELAPQGNVVPVEVLNISDVTNVSATSPDPESQAPDAPAPQEQPVNAQEAEPEPAPAPTPQRPRQRYETDFAALERELMLDKQRPSDARQHVDRAQRGDTVRRGAGLSSAETARIQDHLAAVARAHIDRNNCRRSLADMRDPDRLVVTLDIEFDRNGHLRGNPRVVSPTSYQGDPEMRVAVDYALRAMRQCDPFPFPDDPILRDHYDIWREMTYTFHPRNQ